MLCFLTDSTIHNPLSTIKSTPTISKKILYSRLFVSKLPFLHRGGRVKNIAFSEID